jgi:hypothetical protein
VPISRLLSSREHGAATFAIERGRKPGYANWLSNAWMDVTSSTSTHIQSQGKVTCPFLTTADSSFPLTQGGEEARE